MYTLSRMQTYPSTMGDYHVVVLKGEATSFQPVISDVEYLEGKLYDKAPKSFKKWQFVTQQESLKTTTTSDYTTRLNKYMKCHQDNSRKQSQCTSFATASTVVL